MSSRRLAARLAWREVRRRPGRTALVMMLIALPVAGMTGASMIFRAGDDSGLELYEYEYGQADLAVSIGGSEFPDRVRSLVDQELPIGSRIVPVAGLWADVVVARADGERVLSSVGLDDLPLDDPITDGIVDIERGRAPIDEDEILLHPDLADEWGVDIGAEIEAIRPEAEWTVVGVGRRGRSLDDPFVVLGALDRATIRDGALTARLLVDLPDETTDAQVATAVSRISRGDVWVQDRATAELRFPSADQATLVWIWVFGVVGLAVVGVVVAAAFATSARRQLVTVGQLGVNGAPEPVVRRSLALQGAWSGALGALVGIVGGTVAVSVAWSFVESVGGERLDGRRFAPLDLTAIVVTATVSATIAAAAPARTASRVPLLSALAGRRPQPLAPRWHAPVAAVAAVSGLVLLANASRQQQDGDEGLLAGVVGGLALLAAVVLGAGMVVAMIGRLGRRASGVARLATRELDRDRRRSAGIIAGTAAVAGLAMVAMTIAATSDAEQLADAERREQRLPPNTVELFWVPTDRLIDDVAPEAPPFPGPLLADITDWFPGAEVEEIRGDLGPAGRRLVFASEIDRDGERLLRQILQTDGGSSPFLDGDADAGAPGGGERDGFWWFDGRTEPTRESGLVTTVAVGLATLLVSGVVGAGLALTAAENRPERSVLHAVGAPPRTVARLAATTAWIQAATGIALALPLGYLAVAVVRRTWDAGLPTVPWVGTVVLAVGVPALVAAAAWTASTITSRANRRRGAGLLGARLAA